MFGVTILGSNSALPAFNRHPTSQAVVLNENVFLLDCGEGTQMQMARYKIRRSKIDHIFISHMHGDHYFGLPGVITSMGLAGREHDLHIYAPEAMENIMQQIIHAAGSVFPFKLHFHHLKDEGVLLETNHYSIITFNVTHRIACKGFLIKEKRAPRKIVAAKAKQQNIPFHFFERLKQGEDYVDANGTIIKNESVTIANTPARSYAYCADTAYDESIADKIKNVTTMYHEATYLNNYTQQAAERYHSTAQQAAQIAKLANAKHLLIGHFSSKYEELDTFLEEAKEIFPDTQLAKEGVSFRIV